MPTKNDSFMSPSFDSKDITPDEIRQKAKQALEKPRANGKAGEGLRVAGGMLLGGILLKALLSDTPRRFKPASVSTAREIGESIRLRRADLEMTQEQLADKAGTAMRIIGEIEHGKETAEVGKVLDLLDALNLEVRILPKG